MKSCAKESGIDVTTYCDVMQNREWAVFERIRDTEQRIPCSFRLQPSSNRRVANSGGLHLLHHMRKSVTIARWNLLMFLGLKTCVLVVLCGHLKPANFAVWQRRRAGILYCMPLKKIITPRNFLCVRSKTIRMASLAHHNFF